MSIPRNWRTRQQRYSLKAEVCNTCHEHIFPPRDVCPHCASELRDLRVFAVETVESLVDGESNQRLVELAVCSGLVTDQVLLAFFATVDRLSETDEGRRMMEGYIANKLAERR